MKKVFALVLSLVLLLGIAVPGTLAMDADPKAESTAATEATVPATTAETTTATVETTAPAATFSETTAVTKSSSAETTAATTETTTPAGTEATDPTVETEGVKETEASTPVCTCDPKPAEGEAHKEGCPLYVAPKEEETFDVAKAYEHVMSLKTDEEITAYLGTLTDEQYKALEAYAANKDAENPPKVVSKTFTNAGPFMPAVKVTSTSSRLRAARSAALASTNARIDNEGIVTSKTITPNEDGTYTLRLESYVTGTTTTSTTTKAIPVDIVLVLDQSGSMAWDFNGNNADENTARRQYAMKEAVQNFIGEVAKKYSAECDNRMAIVTFGSSASTLQGWTFVNAAGETTLKSKVSDLPNTPSGATNAGAGMQTAETLMGSGYSYTGTNTNRQKVVIMFTDGVPTTQSDFSVSVANTAISSAYNLKQKGVTVYSIGIFSGVNPTQMYGSEGFARNSDGSVGSDWSNFSVWMIGDIKGYDVPAGNRFLNLLSSNFRGANEIGIKNYTRTFLGIGYYGWQITKNFDRTASSYYLTATDSASLNAIFQTISENIQTGSASVQLGTETKVQDVISDYFELPANADASSIAVKTAPYTADGNWGTEVDSGLTATVDDKTITVTGFDFSQNYCDTTKGRVDGNNNAEGTFYGRKLIIEIPIVVRTGFLGGDGVPTNTTSSAVISPAGEIMEQFTVPTAKVAVSTPVVEVLDKNVYLTGTVSLDEMKNGATVTANGNNLLDDSMTWQDDFVTITPSTPTEAEDLENLEADSTYTLTYTITSNKNGTNKASGNGSAKINVFTPVVTFQDSELNLRDIPKYADENYVSVVWEHTADVEGQPVTVKSTEVSMTGNEPTLTYIYDPISGGTLTAEREVQVTEVKIDNTDVLPYTTFIRKACTFNGCGHKADSTVTTKDQTKWVNFVVHVNTFDLTITKSGVEEQDAGAPFVFNVSGNGVNMDVVVYGNRSVTIKDLPAGTYTVSEKSGYWRYTCQTGDQTVTPTSIKSVTFENKRTENKWLDDFASATNKFINGSVERS